MQNKVEDEQDAAHRDGAVGKVEDGKAEEADFQKVHHIAVGNAVIEIAQRAAHDEGEGKVGQRVGVKTPEIEKEQQPQRRDGQQREQQAPAGQDGKGRAGVFGVGEVQHARPEGDAALRPEHLDAPLLDHPVGREDNGDDEQGPDGERGGLFGG